MTKAAHPIAAYYPADTDWPPAEQLLPLAMLPREMRQALLAEVQTLAGMEYEFLAAQRLISQLDLHVLSLTYQTMARADLLKAMYCWSPEMEELDRQHRQEYLDAMHELLEWMHAQVLGHVTGAKKR